MRSIVRTLLQFPLRWKLVGANALLLCAGLYVALAPRAANERGAALALLFIAAVVNVVLVFLALVPMATIQDVAEAIVHGDYGRRVPPMLLADRDADSSRRAFNSLLDHLAAENARVRRLAGQVTHAREVEQVALAHNLREGVAQNLFALTMELGAVAREPGKPIAAARARAAHAMAQECLEEVRSLAGTLAPGALTELGLRPALETLARRISSERGGIDIAVRVDDALGQPESMAALMLYRVAERSLRNLHAHGDRVRASVSLRRGDTAFELCVEDDGTPVDLDSTDALAAEPGLFGLREMLAQAGGDLRFECTRGKQGTRVIARLPDQRSAAA
jgi:signal transduction histidine kinase